MTPSKVLERVPTEVLKESAWIRMKLPVRPRQWQSLLESQEWSTRSNVETSWPHDRGYSECICADLAILSSVSAPSRMASSTSWKKQSLGGMRVWFLTSVAICILPMHSGTSSGVTNKARWFHTNMQPRHFVWHFIDVVHKCTQQRTRGPFKEKPAVPGTRPCMYMGYVWVISRLLNILRASKIQIETVMNVSSTRVPGSRYHLLPVEYYPYFSDFCTPPPPPSNIVPTQKSMYICIQVACEDLSRKSE